MTGSMTCAVATLAAALLFLAGCDNGPARAQTRPVVQQQMTSNDQPYDSPSLQYLPRQQEVAGWQLKSDPDVYPAKKIGSYSAIESEHYLAFGVLDLAVGEYQRVGTNAIATVEIYRFPDYVQAFGAYSTKRVAVVNFLDIHNESFVGPHSIHIWRGAYYVRVTGPGGALLDPMKELASAVAERMPEAPSKPAVFNFLPDKFRLINSEVYTARPAFGQPALKDAFVASYNVDGEPIDGVAIPAASKQDATRILNEYKKFFSQNGKLLDPIANLGEDNFTGEDQYLGRTVAFRLDRFVFVFRGYRDKQKLVDLAIATDQRVLGTIRKQLVKADKDAEQQQEQPAEPPTSTTPWNVH